MYHMDLSDSVGPNRLPKQAFALSRSHLSADQVVLKISLTDYTQRKRMHVRFKIQLGLESHQALASKLWRRHLNLAQTRKTRRWLLAKAEVFDQLWQSLAQRRRWEQGRLVSDLISLCRRTAKSGYCKIKTGCVQLPSLLAVWESLALS